MPTITGRMTEFGEAKLIEFEGRRNRVYDDFDGRPMVPGVKARGTPTAGIGHTGNDVLAWVGKLIPDEQINRWFKADVARAADIVDRAVKVELTPYQRDSLISFAFNVGPGRAGVKDGFVEVKRGGPSGVLRAVNESRFTDVPKEMRKWVKVGGKVWDGLVRRRDAEAGLWVKGGFVASSTAEVEPDRTEEKRATTGLILAGTATVATTAAAVKPAVEALRDLSAAIEPGMGDMAGAVFPALLAVVAVALVGTWVVRTWQNKQAARL